MEIALSPEMPTYSGGLGVLAGDTIRSAADAGIPMVGITLLHRKGYFLQKISKEGIQFEYPSPWEIEKKLVELSPQVFVELYDRVVHIRGWRWDYCGLQGKIPVFFLDTRLAHNNEEDQKLTDYLYGGAPHYRLCQEIVLGIGGVRLLRALGYNSIERFHMNEGHSSLLAVELLREEMDRMQVSEVTPLILDRVRKRCVFTTHTPIPAGHDQFDKQMVEEVMCDTRILESAHLFSQGKTLNLTSVGFELSHFINGVGKRHGEVTRQLFPNYSIEAITNGVHAATWVSSAFRDLFSRYIPRWESDNASLRYILNVPLEEIWMAHQSAKRELLSFVCQHAKRELREDIFTIGFGRRITAYKRPLLLFADHERLRAIAKLNGGLQIIYGGKAHPRDYSGKGIIEELIRRGEKEESDIQFVFLENYGMETARKMTAGVDLWLNTPEPPQEASGTSGMKAALNGVPSLSVLDGWWLEGCIEGRTGWAIGTRQIEHGGIYWDATDLYQKLEDVIMPLFHNQRDEFIDVMRHAIALNGSFFTTERMLTSYIAKAYYL